MIWCWYYCGAKDEDDKICGFDDMDVDIFVVAVDVEQGNSIKDGLLLLHGQHILLFFVLLLLLLLLLLQ